MKICVTGGSGFIGTNLLYALKKRYSQAELISIDIRRPTYPVEGVTYKTGDVRDSIALHKLLAGSDKIFHLAAIIGTHESFDNPYAVFETNVGGTLNVLEYAREHEAEVFVAGMPGVWNNPYSISKDAAVRLAQSYHETYGTKVSVLRWFSVYGPYQYVNRYNKAVPMFIDRALKNEPIPIYGDGNQEADFIYAEDAVNAAIDMLESKLWGKVFECATGEGISVNNLIKKIVDLCSSKSVSEHLPMRDGEPAGAKIVANTSKLKSVFPDFAPISVDDGLRRTIAHFGMYPPLD